MAIVASVLLSACSELEETATVESNSEETVAPDMNSQTVLTVAYLLERPDTLERLLIECDGETDPEVFGLSERCDNAFEANHRRYAQELREAFPR